MTQKEKKLDFANSASEDSTFLERQSLWRLDRAHQMFKHVITNAMTPIQPKQMRGGILAGDYAIPSPHI